MSWDLKSHILNHSSAIHNTLGSKRKFDENDSKNQHFTFSCDIGSLIINHSCKCQKDIDDKMKSFMDDLIKYEKVYREVKGKNKKGERTYRNVKFDFSDALLAYHNSASDSTNSNNYSVEPHFHALFHKSQKLSRGYKYLRDAIDHISTKHTLVFNFQEETEKPKVDSKKAADLTWFVKRSSDKDFRNRVNDGWVKKALSDFQEHYKQTGNLQYLLKGYRDLETRCKRLTITHDMEFSLFLSDEQKTTIKTLYSGDRDRILELVKDRSNYLGRAYVEHIHGFSNIIIDEIQKRTNQQMPIIDLDLDLIGQKIERKTKASRSDKFKMTLANAYIQDLNLGLKYAKDEKELKSRMLQLGYTEFAFKAQNVAGKRQRVGFTYKRNGQNTTVYFNKLKMSMKDVRASLVENAKNKNSIVPAELYSHLKAYVPPKCVVYANLKYEQIYHLKSTLDLQGFYVRELDSKAVEFKAKKTYIVDKGNQICVKTQCSVDIERNVKLIADIVLGKGIQKYNITGSEQFKLAMNAELERRKQLRASKVNEVQNSSDFTVKSDEETLKELNDIHLSKHSIDARPDEYRQLFKVRSNALAERDINKLLKTYAVLPIIDNLEMREKLIFMTKCLGVSFREITDDIALENGFSKDELDVFRDTVRQMDNCDSIYLNKLIQKISEGLDEKLVLDESLCNNQLERNIRLIESLTREMDEFQAAHLSKKEYIQKIEDVEQALASDNFYEVQTLMEGLKKEDKRVVEHRLSEQIDVAAAKLDFDRLKESVEDDMKGIRLLDNELLMNQHEPTQQLY